MKLNVYSNSDGVDDRGRLDLLARLMRPTTLSLLDRFDIGPGMSCLDAGCGTGDITFELARRVGPRGRVVGNDIDVVRIEENRLEAADRGLSNVEFQVGDVRKSNAGGAAFDLIYSRFLLDHLRQAEDVVHNIADMLKPGGTLIVEGVDYRGWYSYPPLPAFDRLLDLMSRVRDVTGGTPDFGTRMPVMFLNAQFTDIETNVFQYLQLSGEFKGWVMIALPREKAEWIIVAELAERTELEDLVCQVRAHIEDPRTAVGTPRFIQCWGRKGR